MGYFIALTGGRGRDLMRDVRVNSVTVHSVDNFTSMYLLLAGNDTVPISMCRVRSTECRLVLVQAASQHWLDAVYSYRRRSVVRLSVTTVSAAKRTEQLEIPFEMMTRLGPGNHVLDGGPDPYV